MPEEITTSGSLVTKQKIELPDVLDVLIVGGGPAGTGAAFRAKELDLSALLIDRDAILSILRDWIHPTNSPEKDKKVDSSYGPGGKRIPFPTGDALVDQLVFGDQIPASEVYNKWIEVFYEHNVPAKSGLDLVGMERRDDGVIIAKCMNERTREEEQYPTRSIVLAMGRGVPHRLDIPGNPAGINYKLRDAETFCGGPACVIGGGTSAAEAVIAISNAKIAAGDESDVIWSYRRRNLPKVNTTLAETFFKAYAGNGNIRYMRYSGPLAVLKHSDSSEYVALRYDRREEPGRPPEGSYLEFPKERLLACIGADLPIGFLNELGIAMLREADTEDDLMAVSPIFESQVQGVFMIGDLLAPAYIQTTDFSPDAVQSTVIDHTGNFKQGMTDGCLVMETIRKRLDGADDASIESLLTEKRTEYEGCHKDRMAALKAAKAAEPAAPKEAAPAKAAAAAPAEPPPPPTRIGARLVRLTENNQEEPRFLDPGTVVVGRTVGDLTYPSDEYLQDNHVAFQIEPDVCYVSTDGMNGDAYLRVNVERTVPVGQVLVAGSPSFTLRIDASSAGFQLSHIDPNNPDGAPLRQIPLAEGTNVLGRDSIEPNSANPERKRLSRRHFTLQVKGSVISLRDFGSVNGTYIPVAGALRLSESDEVHCGGQKFRFDGMDTGDDAVAVAPAPAAPAPAAAPAAAAAAPAPEAAPAAAEAPAAEAAPAPAAGGAPGVSFANAEIGESIDPGFSGTLLDQMIEKGLATDKPDKIGGKVQNLWSCKGGTCGLCVVRVASGGEAFNAAKGKEKRTVKVMGHDVADHRLACCISEVNGAAQVECLGNTDEDD